MDYCIWFYDINNKCYTTGCYNQERGGKCKQSIKISQGTV